MRANVSGNDDQACTALQGHDRQIDPILASAPIIGRAIFCGAAKRRFIWHLDGGMEYDYVMYKMPPRNRVLTSR